MERNQERDFGRVGAWIEHRYGRGPAEESVRELVRQLLALAGEVAPPVRLGNLLPKRHVSKIRYVNGGPDAHLRVQDQTFVIEVKRGSPRSRVRFSIAHELVHTFFYDLDSPNLRRACPVPHGHPDEERLCDIGAAELLMPARFVESALAAAPRPGEEDFSLDVFRRLVTRFAVSPEALARRLVQDLGMWQALLVGCRWLPKVADDAESSERGEETWRVSWSTKPTGLRGILYLPPRKTRPAVRSKAVELAYQSRGEVSSADPASIPPISNLRRVARESAGSCARHLVHILPIMPERASRRLTDGGADDEGNAESLRELAVRRHTEIIICLPLAASVC